MENKSYWFITVMRKLEKNSKGFLETSCSRCWGFYSNKEDALNTLHENRTDLWETVYDYAVLEEYYEGINNFNFENRQFFRYNKEKNGYFEIEEPSEAKYRAGFALC